MSKYQEILNHFPPSTQNNSRSIIKGLLDRYIQKPSYGLELRLKGFGIGVIHGMEYGDDYPRQEGFCLLEEGQYEWSDEWLNDSQLATLLK